MALLGDVDTVERNLRANPSSSLNVDALARLVDIQKAVTAYVEARTGRSFGDGADEDTIAVSAPRRADISGVFGASSILVLPQAVRSISRVAVDAVWSGAGWSGGETVPASAYRPTMLTRSGDAMALESVSGEAWLGRYVVTGVFETTDGDADVPDEITYVANLLIGEQFKYEQTSTAAVSGPDGQTLPIKNVYKNPLVDAILERYAVSTNTVVI
jgi:hypothetical protein